MASNLVKDIPTTGDDPTEFVETNTNSFFCRPTTPEEIVSLLRNIKSNTSSSFDNVEPHIIREISPQIAPLLSHIFNNSFSTGVVPRQLKLAKVIQIHDPNNFCNYRPISILPCFSKILKIKSTRTLGSIHFFQFKFTHIGKSLPRYAVNIDIKITIQKIQDVYVDM